MHGSALSCSPDSHLDLWVEAASLPRAPASCKWKSGPWEAEGGAGRYHRMLAVDELDSCVMHQRVCFWKQRNSFVYLCMPST